MTRLTPDEEFMKIANSPEAWMRSGETLRECAVILGALHTVSIRAALSGDTSESALRYLSGTGQVFQMLAGLAIENLAKALLVHRKLVSVTKGRITRSDLQAHGVETLLGRARVKLSKEERRLIRRLDKAVDWSGRYPVPLTSTTLTMQGQHVSTLTGPEEFTTLFRRLASELPPLGKPHFVLSREMSLAKQDPPGPTGK